MKDIIMRIIIAGIILSIFLFLVFIFNVDIFWLYPDSRLYQDIVGPLLDSLNIFFIASLLIVLPSLIWIRLPEALYKKAFIRRVGYCFLGIIPSAFLFSIILVLLGISPFIPFPTGEVCFACPFLLLPGLIGIILSTIAFPRLVRRLRKALKEIKEGETAKTQDIG